MGQTKILCDADVEAFLKKAPELSILCDADVAHPRRCFHHRPCLRLCQLQEHDAAHLADKFSSRHGSNAALLQPQLMTDHLNSSKCKMQEHTTDNESTAQNG